jgi:ankyrin repeat protein
VELTRFLIEYGADVPTQDKKGSAPLHQVSKIGNIELARLLVEHGADVMAQNENGSTPLHQASGLRRRESEAWNLHASSSNMVRTWETQDKNGSTPLHQASKKRSVAFARLLVEHGADGSAKDNDGSTPLNQATKM